MADIFVSYANTDRPRAQQIASVLQHRGWSVWWDRAIPAGRRFEDVITEQLSQARCVVALWSQASVASTWVREEAADARDRNALIPVLIERVNPPLGFRGIQAADLTTWNGAEDSGTLTQLLADVESMLGAPHAVTAKQHHPSPPTPSRSDPTKPTSAAAARSERQPKRRRNEASPSKHDVDAGEAPSPQSPLFDTRTAGHPLAHAQLMVMIGLFALMAFIDVVVVFSGDSVAWYGGRANEAGSEFTIPLAAAAMALGAVLIGLGRRQGSAVLRRYGLVSAAGSALLSAIHWYIMTLSYGSERSLSNREGVAMLALLADILVIAFVGRDWWRLETTGGPKPAGDAYRF
jgi:hypothetical protein